VLHITSQEVASFASDLEKLLAEDPYVRVIRVVQQNTTLADGKVSCELISFISRCFSRFLFVSFLFFRFSFRFFSFKCST